MNWNEKERWFSDSLEHLGALKSKDSFSGVGASQGGPDGLETGRLAFTAFPPPPSTPLPYTSQA